MDKKKHINYFLILFFTGLIASVLPSVSALAGSELQKDDLFFTTSVDNNSPTERTMIVYVSRLYDGVGIVKSLVTPPSMESGKIYSLFEKPSKKVETVNGRDYIVMEFRYAVFPEISGNLVIKPPKFSGTVYGKVIKGKPVFRDKNGALASNPFHNVITEGYRQAEVVAEPVKLRVMPSFGKHIIAEDIEVNDKWVPANDMVELGQTLTRTITIKLKGANPEILPKIEVQQISDFKVYSNNISSKMEADKYGITAEFTRDTVYIPQKEGTFKIPEITIDWTHGKTGENKSFSIPSKTISIVPVGSSPVPVYASFEDQEEQEPEEFFLFKLIKKWANNNDSNGFLESFLVSAFVSLIVILLLKLIIKTINKVMQPPSSAFGEDNRDKAYEAILNKKRKK